MILLRSAHAHSPARHPPAFTWTPDLASGATLKGFVDFENNGKITTASGAVSQIVDSVSAAAFAQATAGSRPALITSATSGRQVASFDGVDDCLEISSIPTGWPTGANPVNIIAVCNQLAPDSDATTRAAVSWGGGASASIYLLGRNTVNPAGVRFQVGNGTAAISVNLAALDFVGWRVVRGYADGANAYAEIDGQLSAATAAVPATGTTRARIASGGLLAAGNFWKGEISAILVYAGTLSQQDLNNLYIWSRIRMGM